jgi:Na+-transporting methylmalonyl-CoA/oxaloacetate decarboxylase gamma subunit
MEQTLVDALWIGVIGLFLVFLALALLWVIMTFLVNITSKQALTEAEDAAEADEVPIEEAPAAQSDATLLHPKVAAAGVAVALAMLKKGQYPPQQSMAIRLPTLSQEGGSFGAWQPVLRANQLNQKSRMYSRKQRGNGQ